MARLNGILTKLQGSVGSFTFKQNGGQTVVSEKITQTTNAKTNGQQKQRMKWTNVIRMYQVLTPYLKLAFSGARNGRSDYNKFVSANLGKAPVYLTKQEAQAGASIVAPYEVTHGSIKPISVSGKGNQAVTDISLGDLAITDETMVKEFSNAVVQNNGLYEYGDQITFFLVRQEVNDVTMLPMAAVDACCVVLDKASEAKLLTVVDARGFSVQEGRLAAQATHEFGDHGLVWIHSRKEAAKTLVSTQLLICKNNLLKEYQGQAAYQRATDSYGGVSDVYLRPNGVLNPVENSVPVAPSVEGKKTLRLSASPVNGGTVSGGGSFDKGSRVSISAVASGDYTFSRWSDGDTSASRTVTVNEDLSLTAYFTKTTSGGESSETNPDGGGGNLGD